MFPNGGMANSGHMQYQAVPSIEPADGEDLRPGYSSEKYSDGTRKGLLGIAQLFIHLRKDELLNVETRSVYGSAIALPQIARTAGWPTHLNLLALRSYLFLILNFFLQAFFLYMIDKDEQVMDKFAGQMYLCDFGAHMGSLGPGGTRYRPERVYDYESWVTRNFVRDSLLVLFPDKADVIESKVDPGEYGVESSTCRILCCFIFVASLNSELVAILNMARLLILIPSHGEPWVQYEPSPGVKPTIQIAGIPVCWKILTWLTCVIPKLILWRLTVSAGMNFLLDTDEVTEVIINTVALDFVLGIDEMLFDSITAPETRGLMEELQGFDYDEREVQTEEELLEAEATRISRFQCWKATPTRLLFVIVMALVFVSEYYITNCTRDVDGYLVSKPQWLPKSTHLSTLSFLLPWWGQAHGEVPYWSMPEENSN